MREVLHEKISNNTDINYTWDSMCRHIPHNDLQQVLKKQFVSKWIDLRAKAFVNCYVQVVKRHAKKSKGGKLKSFSKKAEPAMRKKLT